MVRISPFMMDTEDGIPLNVLKKIKIVSLLWIPPPFN